MALGERWKRLIALGLGLCLGAVLYRSTVYASAPDENTQGTTQCHPDGIRIWLRPQEHISLLTIFAAHELQHAIQCQRYGPARFAAMSFNDDSAELLEIEAFGTMHRAAGSAPMECVVQTYEDLKLYDLDTDDSQRRHRILEACDY